MDDKPEFSRRDAIRISIGTTAAFVFSRFIPSTKIPPSVPAYVELDMIKAWYACRLQLLDKLFSQVYNTSPLLCSLMENAEKEKIREECVTEFMRQ